MTNFEKIKSMDVKELARFLDEITDLCHSNDCTGCPLNNGAMNCDDENIERCLNEDVDDE